MAVDGDRCGRRRTNHGPVIRFPTLGGAVAEYCLRCGRRDPPAPESTRKVHFDRDESGRARCGHSGGYELRLSTELDDVTCDTCRWLARLDARKAACGSIPV